MRSIHTLFALIASCLLGAAEALAEREARVLSYNGVLYFDSLGDFSAGRGTIVHGSTPQTVFVAYDSRDLHLQEIPRFLDSPTEGSERMLLVFRSTSSGSYTELLLGENRYPLASGAVFALKTVGSDEPLVTISYRRSDRPVLSVVDRRSPGKKLSSVYLGTEWLISTGENTDIDVVDPLLDDVIAYVVDRGTITLNGIPQPPGVLLGSAVPLEALSKNPCLDSGRTITIGTEQLPAQEIIPIGVTPAKLTAFYAGGNAAELIEVTKTAKGCIGRRVPL